MELWEEEREIWERGMGIIQNAYNCKHVCNLFSISYIDINKYTSSLKAIIIKNNYVYDAKCIRYIATYTNYYINRSQMAWTAYKTLKGARGIRKNM